MDAKDRREKLIEPGAAYNGIDFVEVANDAQTLLVVHFLNDVALRGTVTAVTITGGETIRSVTAGPVNDNADWGHDGNHVVLQLSVAAPGDFSNYTLTLKSRQLDLFFSQVLFSFKARCPSTLDCEAPPPPCPPLPGDAPPIDYLTKDFLSFRQALLDFSALRYPQWQERSEADFGMMFLEALSALADDLSHTQDRIAAESALNTATQRRSAVRLARLVDYEPAPATSAAVLLQFDVGPGVSKLPDGLVVTAIGPDGAAVPFETGGSLANRLLDASGNRLNTPPGSPTNPAWNTGVIKPYWFDDSQRCLPAGATSMYVQGHGFDFFAGQALLIETAGATSADPPIRQIVHLSATDFASELCDPLYPAKVDLDSPLSPPFFTCPVSPPATMAPRAVTQIFWQATDALLVNRDLTQTTLAGNLIPATQGLTLKVSATAPFAQQLSESFIIPTQPAAVSSLPSAIVRTGTNDTPAAPSLQYLYPLSKTPVAWLQPADPEGAPAPEILLQQRGAIQAAGQWPFVTRLLDAGEQSNAFTLDAALYSPVGRSADGTTPYYDYDGDGGDTIRFGDGTFGNLPLPGTIFDVTYRVTAGGDGNVAADSVTQLNPATMAAGVTAATNPLPAAGGEDPEPLATIARQAPEEFRAVQYRAVRPEDYQAAAQTLPWVLRANTAFRWTGSWLTVFTTVDPLASEQITSDEQTILINLLNRYRMAGYESYVPAAQYVSLDLVIDVCAAASAFNADVEKAVLAVLDPEGSSSGRPGFFNHANFTFGQPLERSDLEAAIQGAPGVAGVMCVCYRVRNRTATLAAMPDVVAVAPDEIIRCDNDPSLPEHGSINLRVNGGK